MRRTGELVLDDVGAVIPFLVRPSRHQDARTGLRVLGQAVNDRRDSATSAWGEVVSRRQGVDLSSMGHVRPSDATLPPA